MALRETIEKAWRNLRKGKTNRPAVIAIENDFDNEVSRMQTMILNTKPDGYEVEHPELAYEPPKKRRTKEINERGKRRIAYLAEIREQWYFHIIVEVLKPIVMKDLNPHVYGSIPGRGPHTGKKHIEKQIRSGKRIKHFLKTDIRHFYDTLTIAVIIRELRRVIADDLFLYCIAKIYKYCPKGIMIGLFISPWLANFVLIRLDFCITSIDGTTLYRYMDDTVVFAGSKRILHMALEAIKKMLGRLRLRLKSNYQICRYDYETRRTRIRRDGTFYRVHIGRPLDFMGFVFFRDRTTIRKGILLRAARGARRLHKAKEKGRRYYLRAVRAMVSRIGWFSHTDSYGCYLEKVKPFVEIGKLKRIISKIDKRGAIENDRMEERTVLGKAA